MHTVSPKSVSLFLAGPAITALVLVACLVNEVWSPLEQSRRLQRVSAISEFLGEVVEQLHLERRRAILYTWGGDDESLNEYSIQIASTDRIADALEERLAAYDDGDRWMTRLHGHIDDSLNALDSVRSRAMHRRRNPAVRPDAWEEYSGYVRVTDEMLGALSRSALELDYGDQTEILALITLLKIQDSVGAEAGLGHAVFSGLESFSDDQRRFLKVTMRRDIMIDRFAALAPARWSAALEAVMSDDAYADIPNARQAIISADSPGDLDPGRAEPWLESMLALQGEIASFKSRYLGALTMQMDREAADLRRRGLLLAAFGAVLLIAALALSLLGYRSIRRELVAGAGETPDRNPAASSG